MGGVENVMLRVLHNLFLVFLVSMFYLPTYANKCLIEMQENMV